MNAIKWMISLGYVWISHHLCVMLVLILSLGTALQIAQAAPCFDSPKKAYAALIKNEQLQTQAQTQRGININRANEAALISLNGIGSSKAQAIILYREMFGDFKSVDDLAKVKGIGAKTVEKNRSRLQIQD